MAAPHPARILVVRNDKLGDFMLAWPALRLLKERLPGVEVAVLVPDYTGPMAALCPWIDTVITDSRAPGWRGVVSLANRLRRERFDAALTLFSTSRVAAALWLAHIPYRLAAATKLAQVFYNRRVVQRRSRSEKPEHRYNLELAEHLLRDHGIEPGPAPQPPFLPTDAGQAASIRRALLARLDLPASARLIFVHPGSGGSARNLRLDQYAALCKGLDSPAPLGFVITAGPGEEAAARTLAAQLDDLPRLVSNPADLRTLTEQLQAADLFISGSTGPLHIAGALDRPTAAFYPAHRSGCALRWQTLNSPERRLAFSPPAGGDPTDVSRVDVAAAAAAISLQFLR